MSNSYMGEPDPLGAARHCEKSHIHVGGRVQVMAMVHQLVASCCFIRATNVAWPWEPELGLMVPHGSPMVPQNILSMLSVMIILIPCYRLMTAEARTRKSRYPTGTCTDRKGQISMAPLVCQLRMLQTLQRQERAVLAAHIERSGAQDFLFVHMIWGDKSTYHH